MDTRRFLESLDAEGFDPIHYVGPVYGRLGLLIEARQRSMATIERLLAHASSLCALYASSMPCVEAESPLNNLCARHLAEQHAVIAGLVARAATLGMTSSRYPSGCTRSGATAPLVGSSERALLKRLLEAHELAGSELAGMWRQANIDGDFATRELLDDHVVQTSERQSWLVAERLVRLDEAEAQRQRCMQG